MPVGNRAPRRTTPDPRTPGNRLAGALDGASALRSQVAAQQVLDASSAEAAKSNVQAVASQVPPDLPNELDSIFTRLEALEAQ